MDDRLASERSRGPWVRLQARIPLPHWGRGRLPCGATSPVRRVFIAIARKIATALHAVSALCSWPASQLCWCSSPNRGFSLRNSLKEAFQFLLGTLSAPWDCGRVTCLLTAEESKNLPLGSSSHLFVNPLLFGNCLTAYHKCITKTIINNNNKNQTQVKIHDRRKSVQYCH